MTESWVFLPPSPSLPPRRRKGRGLSNRSDVPAGGRNNNEEDNRPGVKSHLCTVKNRAGEVVTRRSEHCSSMDCYILKYCGTL